MLSEILKEFRNLQEPMDLKNLSLRLGIERSTLEGMIETLVRQGKLREVSPEDCDHCGKKGTCSFKWDETSKIYELAEERELSSNG